MLPNLENLFVQKALRKKTIFFLGGIPTLSVVIHEHKYTKHIDIHYSLEENA